MVGLVIFLVCFEHAIEPREELFGTVIRVQDYWSFDRIASQGGQRRAVEIRTYTP